MRMLPFPPTNANKRSVRAVALLAFGLACICVSIVASMFGLHVLAALAAIGGAFPICAELTASIAETRETSSDDLVSRVAREVESGRKLAIYDQDTGLYAKWYLLLRGEEERVRAKRYGRQFAIGMLSSTAPVGDERWQADADISRWLQTRLRATDVVGYLGHGRYAFIATEADPDRATRLAERLRAGVDNVIVGLSCYPGDGETLEDLWANAEQRLEQPPLAA